MRHQRHHRPRMTHYAMSAGLLAAVKPRFEAFTRHEGGHLLWQLEMHRGAWGRLYVDGRSWSAAAIAWVLDGRPLVVGSRLWRVCAEPRCIAPWHRSVTAVPWGPRRRAAANGTLLRRKMLARAAASGFDAKRIARRLRGVTGPVGEPVTSWAAAGKDQDQ